MLRARRSVSVLIRVLSLVALSVAPAAAAADESNAPGAPSNDAGPTADQIADKVQDFYDKTRTFKAAFKQRYTIKAYNRTKDSQGHVVFEKPGKMSWHYTTNGNRVTSDGKMLRVYEEDNKQMYEQKIDESQYPAALSFLVGEGNLKKAFKLRKLDAARMKFTGGYVLEGTPRDPTPAYQKVLIYVDAKTSQVRRMLLLDAQGNRNRFDFDSPEVNVKIPPTEFQFTAPKGTHVIHP